MKTTSNVLTDYLNKKYTAYQNWVVNTNKPLKLSNGKHYENKYLHPSDVVGMEFRKNSIKIYYNTRIANYPISSVYVHL